MQDNPIIGMDIATESDITEMAIFVGNAFVDAIYDRLLYGEWQEPTLKGLNDYNAKT